GGKCTGCRSCQGACPAGALGDPEELNRAVQQMQGERRPILACRQPGLQGHGRLACLGMLDEEALLALPALFAEGVTLNLTRCGECVNAAIIPLLQRRQATLAQLPDWDASLLQLASTTADLKFREEGLSRRQFFTFFRHRSASVVDTSLRRLQPPAPESYGAKRLPAGRRLLLRALSAYPPALQEEIRRRLFPGLSFQETCRSCTSCVGICPTGSLSVAVTGAPRPVFTPALCTGCAGCSEFCRQQSAVLTLPS
ncbi:MAG: hypothetical protein IH614_04025, partial [Desulfuromonadales bacterium]|nr:hypothetical protein [Desulfuromonadales bacterium]